jgi:hypothetical protein
MTPAPSTRIRCSRFRLVAPLLLLLFLAAAVPGCSDGEGTIFTITTVPDATGGDPLLVYRTRAPGWDEATQRTFNAYVEVYGVHSEEFLTMGIRSLTVFVRMFTFDGPGWPVDDMELRSDQRATLLLASGFSVETGQDQIEVPETGAKQAANFIACGTSGGTLLAISANKLITVKTGAMEVELDFDQLQGLAKLLDRLNSPPPPKTPPQ